MKIYRLLLFSVICMLAFVMGWFLRGQYLPSASPLRIDSPNMALEPVSSKPTPFLSRCLDLFKNSTLYARPNLTNLKPDSTLKPTTSLETKADKLPSELSQELAQKQKQYDILNRKYLLSLPQNPNFVLKGAYSFLINVFSKEEEAVKYVDKLKKQYPLWNIFIKMYNGGTKIYLGPFETIKKANRFMDSITKKPFPNYVLEKQSL